MIRYLIDVYEIQIPEEENHNRDSHDLAESTENWLFKLGRYRCYKYQIQGNTFSELAEALMKHADER